MLIFLCSKGSEISNETPLLNVGHRAYCINCIHITRIVMRCNIIRIDYNHPRDGLQVVLDEVSLHDSARAVNCAARLEREGPVWQRRHQRRAVLLHGDDALVPHRHLHGAAQRVQKYYSSLVVPWYLKRRPLYKHIYNLYDNSY